MHSKVSMLPAHSRSSHSAPNSLELSLVQEGIPGRSSSEDYWPFLQRVPQILHGKEQPPAY